MSVATRTKILACSVLLSWLILSWLYITPLQGVVADFNLSPNIFRIVVYVLSILSGLVSAWLIGVFLFLVFIYGK